MSKLVLVGLIALALWLLMRRQSVKPTLGETEAREILGVGGSADAEAIRAAHRRLVAAVHPDRGGSADLTRRINAARDTLLKRRD